MSERDAVLFANEAFYAAFTARDIAAMDEVWAKERPVGCIHPGWQALSGRAAVMESWRAILGGGETPRIASRAEQVFLHGTFAVVTCVEQLTTSDGANYLAATNVFVKAGALWHMVHHQAGPLNVPLPATEEERKPSVN